MDKIKKLSRIFKYVFWAMLIAYPLLEIYCWVAKLNNLEGAFSAMTDGFSFSTTISFLSSVKIYHELTWLDRLLGFLIELIPNLLTMAVLYCMAKLFSLYGKGKIFVVESGRYLKKAGFFMLIGAIVRPLIFHPLLQFVLTMNAPDGKRFTAIELGTYDFYNIFISLIVILISWNMIEACKMREEQDLTI